ncbi:hypothetical protein L596_024666 [Steinernema carpocapsae]|uniref:Uncharacterized protein n=1 Tax=Steinernema carpocapsae TaxID=34508 RepID=A0A4U5M5E6_STECR|nr:hypothetical protein L596_024666 [Steinernema carpocapsae]
MPLNDYQLYPTTPSRLPKSKNCIAIYGKMDKVAQLFPQHLGKRVSTKALPDDKVRGAQFCHFRLILTFE